MGTQRAAVSAGRVRYGRFHGLKGVAFWGFLFAASFVFGMLVVSPLLTAAGVGGHEDSRSQAQSAATHSVSPQPVPPAAAAIMPQPEEKRAKKGVAPDIQLSVEPSARN